jgi:ubiquinone/menaquinone biosynthesis C-methylase UbiE
VAEYFFEHDWLHERERLRRLEQFYDPLTHANLEHVGIQPGWYCLEAGGGGGSIAEWLAWRVGPTGRVLVTDLETRFLDRLSGPNIEVRQHRLGSDPLPNDTFDLVHARAVMEHQPDRMPALKQIYRCLRPGGWVVLESADFTSVAASRPEHSDLFNHVWGLFKATLEARGFSWSCGRYLSQELVKVGFGQVRYEGRAYEWGGDDGPLTAFYLQTFDRLKLGLEGLDSADKRDVRRFLTMCKKPSFRATSHITCTVMGQKPIGRM